LFKSKINPEFRISIGKIQTILRTNKPIY